MFENYLNINTQYTPNNYQPKYLNCDSDLLQSASPNKPYEVLNELGNIIGYFWYYGDSVLLNFDIYGEYTSELSDTFVDIDGVLMNCNATITMYNFRHNIVHQETKPATKELQFTINKELSKKLIRGRYTILLVITSEETLYSLTLFSTSDCVFEVR